MQLNTLNLMVSVKTFQVCKIYSDEQENIIVTTPANKQLLTLNCFWFFFVIFSVKFYRFCKIYHSSITADNHKSPFDFIWLNLIFALKQANDIFVNFNIEKPNTKPTY